MAYDHDVIIQAQHQQLTQNRAQAFAEYEAARGSEDSYAVMDAANRILDADQKLAALNRIATNYVASQQAQPQRHPSGLSDQEIEIAKASHSGGTPEERIREYAANKSKYLRMRASGEYRDDQGTVRR